jgi:Mg2+ and Co2+ transporter CorA
MMTLQERKEIHQENRRLWRLLRRLYEETKDDCLSSIIDDVQEALAERERSLCEASEQIRKQQREATS